MKNIIRTSLAILSLSLVAPAVSFAQTSNPCPAGYTYTQLPGGGFECTPDDTAPEISASTSVAGLALVAGFGLIMRGRKRVQTDAKRSVLCCARGYW